MNRTHWRAAPALLAGTLCVTGVVEGQPLDAPAAGESVTAPDSESHPTHTGDGGADPGEESTSSGPPSVVVVPAVVESPAPTPENTTAAPVDTVGETGSPADPASAEAVPVEEAATSGFSLLYLTAGAGLSYLEGVLFSEENFVPEIGRLNGDGVSFSGAFGLQFLVFQLGARVTYALLEALDLGTAGAEFALRIPIPVLEPFLRVGAGYTWTSDNGVLNTALARPGGASIDGYYLEVGAGLDVFLTSSFAIGASVDGVFLNLTRQSLSDCGGASCLVDSINLAESGDALGILVRGQVSARLEFP